MRMWRLGWLGLALILSGCGGQEKDGQVEGEFKPADTSQFKGMLGPQTQQLQKSGAKINAPSTGAATEKAK